MRRHCCAVGPKQADMSFVVEFFCPQMETLGIEAKPEEVDLMIDEIDQDNNGEIDFEGAAQPTYT